MTNFRLVGSVDAVGIISCGVAGIAVMIIGISNFFVSSSRLETILGRTKSPAMTGIVSAFFVIQVSKRSRGVKKVGATFVTWTGLLMVLLSVIGYMHFVSGTIQPSLYLIFSSLILAAVALESILAIVLFTRSS